MKDKLSVMSLQILLSYIVCIRLIKNGAIRRTDNAADSGSLHLSLPFSHSLGKDRLRLTRGEWTLSGIV